MKTFTVPDHGLKVGSRYEDPDTGKLWIVDGVFGPAVFKARPMTDAENRRLWAVRIGAWICGVIVTIFVIGVLSLVLCSNG